MKIETDLIEDLLKFGSAAMGSLFEGKRGAKTIIGSQFEVIARRLDLVTREEFDAAFAMIAKARLKQEELSERLAALESKMGISPKANKSRARRSAATQNKKEKTASKGNLLSVKQGNRKRARKA